MSFENRKSVTFEDLERGHQSIVDAIDAALALREVIAFRRESISQLNAVPVEHRMNEAAHALEVKQRLVEWSEDYSHLVVAACSFSGRISSFMDQLFHSYFSPVCWHAVAANVVDHLAESVHEGWPSMDVGTRILKKSAQDAAAWVQSSLDEIAQRIERQMSEIPLDAIRKEAGRWRAAQQGVRHDSIDPSTLRSTAASDKHEDLPRIPSGKMSIAEIRLHYDRNASWHDALRKRLTRWANQDRGINIGPESHKAEAIRDRSRDELDWRYPASKVSEFAADIDQKRKK